MELSVLWGVFCFHPFDKSRSKHQKKNKRSSKKSKETETYEDVDEDSDEKPNENYTQTEEYTTFHQTEIPLESSDHKNSNHKKTKQKRPHAKSFIKENLSQHKKQKKPKKSKKKEKEKNIFLEELKKKENREALLYIIKQFMQLLSHFKPTICYADIAYSVGEPDLTGKLTGIISMLPFVYGKKNHYYPDFSANDPYIHGTIKLKGRITVIFLLIAVIKILINKTCRKLIFKLF